LEIGLSAPAEVVCRQLFSNFVCSVSLPLFLILFLNLSLLGVCFCFLGTWSDEKKADHKKKCDDGGGRQSNESHENKMRFVLNGNSGCDEDLQEQLQRVYQQTKGGKNALEFRKGRMGRNGKEYPAINRNISIVFYTFEDNDDWKEQKAYLMYDSTDEEELFNVERACVCYNGLGKLLFPERIGVSNSPYFAAHRYLFVAGTSDRICDIEIESENDSDSDSDY
jgi:hypothetical protein